MKVINISQMILRVCFLLALILGILFWLGKLDNLTIVHIILGLIVVVTLWLIGLSQGFMKIGSFGLAVATFIVGLALAIVGLYQQNWLTNSYHWIIQVIHLLLALSAVGLAEMVAGRTKRLARGVKNSGQLQATPGNPLAQ